MTHSPLTSHLSPLSPKEDTICALATATGGALGIIRVSGPAAFSVVSSLCSLSFDSVAANTIRYTRIFAQPFSSSGQEDSQQEGAAVGHGLGQLDAQQP